MTIDVTSDTASSIFDRLDPTAVALLLDIDGTLIDIGPSPFAVDVSAELKESLTRLHDLSHGALALVTGRPIRDVDLLFAPLRLPAIGGHGAELRLAQGEQVSRVGDLPEALRRSLIEVVRPDSGIEIEDKGYSVALHYRQAPQEAERLRHHIADTRAAFPDVPTELLLGKAMFEVKRPGVSKGDAVRRLMTVAPYAGRVPIFLGDDVTDESVFDILPALGGQGFGVGRYFPDVAGIFPSPAAVRRALRLMASPARAS